VLYPRLSDDHPGVYYSHREVNIVGGHSGSRIPPYLHSGSRVRILLYTESGTLCSTKRQSHSCRLTSSFFIAHRSTGGTVAHFFSMFVKRAHVKKQAVPCHFEATKTSPSVHAEPTTLLLCLVPPCFSLGVEYHPPSITGCSSFEGVPE